MHVMKVQLFKINSKAEIANTKVHNITNRNDLFLQNIKMIFYNTTTRKGAQKNVNTYE